MKHWVFYSCKKCFVCTLYLTYVQSDLFALKVITAIITCSKIAFSLPLRYFSIIIRKIFVGCFSYLESFFVIPIGGSERKPFEVPMATELVSWVLGAEESAVCSCASGRLTRRPPVLWQVAHSRSLCAHCLPGQGWGPGPWVEGLGAGVPAAWKQHGKSHCPSEPLLSVKWA